MLAIFGVEGVMVDGYLLSKLPTTTRKKKKITQLLQQGLDGSISWEDSIRQSVELLKGISYDDCKIAADRIQLMAGLMKTCAILKTNGWKIMAIGGFSILTDRFRELNIDYVFTNELIFKDGVLDGVKINVTSDKAKYAKIKIAEWREKKENVAVTVDGANDMTLFDICGLGVAFMAQDIVKEKANVTIEEKNILHLIDVINKHYDLQLRLPERKPKREISTKYRDSIQISANVFSQALISVSKDLGKNYPEAHFIIVAKESKDNVDISTSFFNEVLGVLAKQNTPFNVVIKSGSLDFSLQIVSDLFNNATVAAIIGVLAAAVMGRIIVHRHAIKNVTFNETWAIALVLNHHQYVKNYGECEFVSIKVKKNQEAVVIIRDKENVNHSYRLRNDGIISEIV